MNPKRVNNGSACIDRIRSHIGISINIRSSDWFACAIAKPIEPLKMANNMHSIITKLTIRLYVSMTWNNYCISFITMKSNYRKRTTAPSFLPMRRRRNVPFQIIRVFPVVSFRPLNVHCFCLANAQRGGIGNTFDGVPAARYCTHQTFILRRAELFFFIESNIILFVVYIFF